LRTWLGLLTLLLTLGCGLLYLLLLLDCCPPAVVAGLDWPEAAAVARVAADSLSLPLACPLLLVLALQQLVIWLLWPLLWLRRLRLSWPLLLLVQLLLHSAGILSLCPTVIGFGPCSP